MSVSLNRPFKHFDTIDLFNASKVSANAANTSYIQNGTVRTGTPDILWEHTAFIHDVSQIWNRGRFYNSQKYMTKLAAMSKNAFYDYRKTVITIIDKSFESLYSKNMSVYENYPGIIPSIVVAPSIAESKIDIVYALMDRGCDVLSTAYNNVSVYNSSKSDAVNYEEIQNDMTQVEQWLIERGIFTNCYKYPYTDYSKATGESKFISKYEEYAVIEGTIGVNYFDQPNMLFRGYAASSVTAAVDYIDKAAGATTWVIIVVDSSTITGSISSLVSAINDHVEAGDAIYLQMNEALKVRGSEFNIGTASTLPFKVYKNGDVQASLSATSQNAISFTNTNNSNFKSPMLTYVHSNTSYNSFGGKFLNDLASYMYNKLADQFMRYNAANLHTYMASYMNTYFLQIDPPA